MHQSKAKEEVLLYLLRRRRNRHIQDLIVCRFSTVCKPARGGRERMNPQTGREPKKSRRKSKAWLKMVKAGWHAAASSECSPLDPRDI